MTPLAHPHGQAAGTSTSRPNTLLAVMFLFFIAGLASIIASGGN